MEIKKSAIIEKAAKIITSSGIEYLSIPNLAQDLGVDKRKLKNQFTHDDDILVLLLLSFESEFKKITDDFSTQELDPELELKLVFKQIYALFMKKPYYLSIIFDKNLIKRENNVKLAIIRIKNSVSKYLTTLINAGKFSIPFNRKFQRD